MKLEKNRALSEVPVLLSRAKELIAEARDPDLVNAIMIVQGYSQLLDLDPDEITYQSKLNQAARELHILVDARDAG